MVYATTLNGPSLIQSYGAPPIFPEPGLRPAPRYKDQLYPSSTGSMATRKLDRTLSFAFSEMPRPLLMLDRAESCQSFPNTELNYFGRKCSFDMGIAVIREPLP